MKENVRIRRMLLTDGAGLLLSALVLFLFFPDSLLSGLKGYAMGSLCALGGYFLIELQYSTSVRYWKLLVFPGFLLRMLLYGLGLWLTLRWQASPFLFILGISLPYFSLLPDLRR